MPRAGDGICGFAVTWQGLSEAVGSGLRPQVSIVNVGEVGEFQKNSPRYRARLLTQPDLFHHGHCALTSSDVGWRTELNMAIVRFIRQHRGRKRGLTSDDRLFIPKQQRTVDLPTGNRASVGGARWLYL